MVAHDTLPLKTCSKCNNLLPIESFHRDRHKQDGRSAQCKPCRRTRKAWRRCHHCDKYVAPSEFAGPSGHTVECVVCVGSRIRVCRCCGLTKPFEEFRLNAAQTCGWSHYCDSCKRIASGGPPEVHFRCRICHKDWPDSEKYSTQRCRSCINDKGRRCGHCAVFKSWDQYHESEIRCMACKSELGKAVGWYNDAKERWRDENRDYVRAKNRQYGRKRRALMQLSEVDGKDHEAHIQAYTPRFSDGSIPCYLCHQPIDVLNVDHVVPIARGGADTCWNTLPSCRSCNSSKGTREASPVTHGFRTD